MNKLVPIVLSLGIRDEIFTSTYPIIHIILPFQPLSTESSPPSNNIRLSRIQNSFHLPCSVLIPTQPRHNIIQMPKFNHKQPQSLKWVPIFLISSTTKSKQIVHQNKHTQPKRQKKSHQYLKFESAKQMLFKPDSRGAYVLKRQDLLILQKPETQSEP